MTRGTSNERGNEDDAMLTKKPLLNVSCMSCERNIVNMSGQMVDFNPWKKLPFREPNERIARVRYFKLTTLVWTRIFEDSVNATTNRRLKD